MPTRGEAGQDDIVDSSPMYDEGMSTLSSSTPKPEADEVFVKNKLRLRPCVLMLLRRGEPVSKMPRSVP